MTRQHRITLTLALMASATVLAACSGGGGGKKTPPPPPAARLEDGFGAGFATAYRADPNAVPRDPAAGDIIALTLAADPVAIP
ncbi:MAG: hypothetical protein QE280_15335 [Caulobacter sp.]|nr:hypothetical protein [Caulobacter sp.]